MQSVLQSAIQLRGVRTHNLKNISVTFPHGKLTVVTGVSGSGKSSLVEHTLFAEGHYRYLSTMAGHLPQLISRLPRPPLDELVGLSPLVSIPQQRPTPSARSTVATLTGLLDYLKLLYARKGTVICPECQVPVEAQTRHAMVEQLMNLPERTKVQLLAPVVRNKKGAHSALLERIHREGYVRARVDGQILEIGEIEPLAAQKPHSIDVIVDRVIIKPGLEQRLADSLEQVLRLSEGTCRVVTSFEDQENELILQRDLCCPQCGKGIEPLEPRSFSWHNGHGACPECEGTGRREAEICAACEGERLNPVSRRVTVQQQRLPVVLSFSIDQAIDWCSQLEQQTKGDSVQESILLPLIQKLRTIQQLGIDYLTLNRRAETLSGGEIQRLRLAKCLGTQLQGSCFLLDEPTAGLHEQDVVRLRSVMEGLLQEGNTVICIEHQLDLIRAADHLVELGPGGGTEGGHVIFTGSPQELSDQVETATSKALRDSAKIIEPAPVSFAAEQFLQFSELSAFELKSVSCQFPLGSLTLITGISGSGKSSLVEAGIIPLLQQAVRDEQTKEELPGTGNFTASQLPPQPEIVDQQPPGKSIRSCPATICTAWDQIRTILSKTRLAKLRGFNASRFSFNTAAGTCRACQGIGMVRDQTSFAATAWQTCHECLGKRFSQQTLAVTYKGRSAADLLEMTIQEAAEFWSEVSSIARTLVPLLDVGLGYLKMGQSALSLSGGEAQRLKLSRVLTESLEPRIIILDEPTSGLHWQDVTKLIKLLKRLQEAGHTLLVIEHHPQFQTAADWRIEMGPGAGELGGEVLYCGPAHTMQ